MAVFQKLMILALDRLNFGNFPSHLAPTHLPWWRKAGAFIWITSQIIIKVFGIVVTQEEFSFVSKMKQREHEYIMLWRFSPMLFLSKSRSWWNWCWPTWHHLPRGTLFLLLLPILHSSTYLPPVFFVFLVHNNPNNKLFFPQVFHGTGAAVWWKRQENLALMRQLLFLFCY